MISSIPNKDRTTRVLNNIHIMIERFKQLRTTFSTFDDNKKAALEMLYTRIQNDADIAKMILYFGKRQEFAFGIPVGNTKDFNQFVTSNLSKTQIQLLNERYLKNKMKFRF
jgi:hypothetical protein